MHRKYREVWTSGFDYAIRQTDTQTRWYARNISHRSRVEVILVNTNINRHRSSSGKIVVSCRRTMLSAGSLVAETEFTGTQSGHEWRHQQSSVADWCGDCQSFSPAVQSISAAAAAVAAWLAVLLHPRDRQRRLASVRVFDDAPPCTSTFHRTSVGLKQSNNIALGLIRNNTILN